MASQPTTCTENNSPSLLALLPLAFFLKLSVSLCLFLSLSLAPSVSLPLSSLRLLHLYHIFFFFFFLLLSFLPSYSCSHSFSLSVLSLLSAPEAMWSRRGSRVTEAGPFGVASSLSRLRGAAVHVFARVYVVCVCVCLRERGAVLEGKVRCERMMHLIHCEERRKKWGKGVEGETSRGRRGGREVEARTELLALSTPPTGP